MVWLLGEIARLADQMRQALSVGDVSGFGELLGEHWTLNKRMDPGCTNPFIDGLFADLAPHIHGGKLAGAGGGMLWGGTLLLGIVAAILYATIFRQMSVRPDVDQVG